MAGVLLDAHWRKLAARIGRPELADDPRFATAPARIARREEVNGLLADFAAARTVAEVVEALGQQGIPAAPVRSYADAARDPHVAAREMLQSVEQPEGTPVPLTGPAAKLGRTPTRVRAAAPDLGQHSDAILEELGIGPGERARLRADGVV
jgi:formyl-CoA transferase